MAIKVLLLIRHSDKTYTEYKFWIEENALKPLN